jgi:hypothetical protein
MNVETLAMVAELEKIADALDEHFKNILSITCQIHNMVKGQIFQQQNKSI